MIEPLLMLIALIYLYCYFLVLPVFTTSGVTDKNMYAVGCFILLFMYF